MKATQQHHLPRFLQKGFASRESKKGVLAHQFRRAGTTSEPNTKNIGAERDFYGPGGAGTLDDELTRREDEFSDLVDELRSGEQHCGRDRRLAELVAHLVIRTGHLRGGMEDALTKLMDCVVATVTGPAAQSALEVDTLKKIESDPLKHAQYARLRPRARQLLIKRIATQRRVEYGKEARAQVQAIPFVKEIAHAHNRALSKHHATSERIDRLETLEWRVVRPEGGPLVLGDLGPIARLDESFFEHPIRYSRAPVQLVLPIAFDLALVGDLGDLDLPDVDFLNQQVAELSRNFFIASQRTAREEAYALRLGARGELMDREALENLEQALVREISASVPA